MRGLCDESTLSEELLCRKALQSALNSTFYHTFHDLFLCNQEDNDHRQDCKQCCCQDKIPLLNVRTDERLNRNRKCFVLTVI